jgi:hypothetical protein
MIDIPPELEGIEIEIDIEGGSEALAEELRQTFDGEDEDVVFGHAFGGLDIVTIVTKFGAATLGKLVDCWAKIKTTTPKTKLKIDGKSIDIEGFSRDDVLALLASPAFQKAVKGVKAK